MKTTVLVITAVVALASAASAQIDNEFGPGAGNGIMTGSYNTGNGYGALGLNLAGSDNTANGSAALGLNSVGSSNTANGVGALGLNFGGSYNTANGVGALRQNGVGNYNTADGIGALQQNTLGSGNIALGSYAGYNLTTGSNNIDIGSAGVAGESDIIRIGDSQTATFIAGISGTSLSAGTVVAVDSNGQLGTTNLAAGPIGPKGDQGPAGAGLITGAYLTLPHGTAAPAGFTFLGTTTMKYKKLVGTKSKTTAVALDLYQKD